MFYLEVFRALNRGRIQYVVAGGVAVILHGYMRFTVDLDLVVHLEDKNLGKLWDVLHKLGYQPKVPVTREQFTDRKERAKWPKYNMVVFAFFHLKDPTKLIDMFIREPIPFDLLRKKAVNVKSGGLTIPIISLEHLRKLKQKAGRDKDMIDLSNLDEIWRLKRK